MKFPKPSNVLWCWRFIGEYPGHGFFERAYKTAKMSLGLNTFCMPYKVRKEARMYTERYRRTGHLLP
jgi:hypothetical protein